MHLHYQASEGAADLLRSCKFMFMGAVFGAGNPNLCALGLSLSTGSHWERKVLIQGSGGKHLLKPASYTHNIHKLDRWNPEESRTAHLAGQGEASLGVVVRVERLHICIEGQCLIYTLFLFLILLHCRRPPLHKALFRAAAAVGLECLRLIVQALQMGCGSAASVNKVAQCVESSCFCNITSNPDFLACLKIEADCCAALCQNWR